MPTNLHRLRLALLLGAMLAGACAPATAAADPLDTILAGLAQRPHGHVYFEERIEAALLRRPLQATGEMFFDAPDRLEKRTLRPGSEDLLVEGDIVTITRGTHRTSIRLSQYPQVSPLLEGMRATLAGDRNTLERIFNVALEQDGGTWTLTLRPLAGAGDAVYALIRIAGSGASVQSVRMERRNGDRTTMTLTEAGAR